MYTVSGAEFIPHSFNSHACWLKLGRAAVRYLRAVLTGCAIECEFLFDSKCLVLGVTVAI